MQRQHLAPQSQNASSSTGSAQSASAGGMFGGMGNAALAASLQSPFPAVGGDRDTEESQADQLAGQVMSWMGQANAGQNTDTPDNSNPFPAGLAEAFDQIAGFDIHSVDIHQNSRATTDEYGANALAHEGEVHLGGGLLDSLDTLIHELSHVALGHAAPGEPVRREAKATGDTGIGISGYLKKGDRGAMVERLQTLLVQLGYMTAAQKATGPGIFGNRTHAAVTAFQRAKRLTVDGIVGPQTISALAGATSGPATTPTDNGGERGTSTLTGKPALRQGMEGVLVKELQKLLNNYGGGLLIDGEFGPKTAGVVRAFQSANGLTADAIVGPQTASKLNSGSAKSIPKTSTPAEPTPSGPVAVDVDDADPKGLLADSKINPTVRKLATTTIKTMQGKGYSPYVVGGFRSFDYQDGLYAQGRTKPGSIVTYVKGGGSWHNYGLAVDIVFWNKSHTGPSWDGSLPWKTLGAAGKAAGFTRWMGDSGWDFAHFEHHPKWGNGCYDLASTYKSQGLSAVWNKVM